MCAICNLFNLKLYFNYLILLNLQEVLELTHYLGIEREIKMQMDDILREFGDLKDTLVSTHSTVDLIIYEEYKSSRF